MRLANLLFLLAFLLSVAVQHNDPDPLRWMALYAAAAAACLAWDRRWGPRWLPAVPGGVALAWSVAVLVAVPAGVDVGHAVTDWHMHAGGSEEVRELGGLWLVVGWMGALAWRPR